MKDHKQCQCRIDTHFHANIRYLPQASRLRKKRTLSSTLSHLDVICSTEHAYKEPLEAFDFMEEVQDENGLNLTVVPGVENISTEGIELIFIASSRSHLVKILNDLPAFEWSIYDQDRIENVDAVTIVPHPFSPSKTGIVTSIGLEAAIKIMPNYTYVETCNGAFLNPLYANIPFNPYKEKIVNTAYFPPAYKFEGFVGSVGSDAHKVDDLCCFGMMGEYDPAISVFDNLMHRKSMTAEMVAMSNNPLVAAVSSLMITGIEAVHKKSMRIF